MLSLLELEAAAAAAAAAEVAAEVAKAAAVAFASSPRERVRRQCLYATKGRGDNPSAR